MARIAAVLALLGLLLSASPGAPPTPWGGVVGPASAGAQEVPTAQPVQVTGPEAGSGLPQRPPDPRTLGEYWPVFALFSLTWLGIVAYFLSLGKPLARTARSVQQLDGERSVPRGEG